MTTPQHRPECPRAVYVKGTMSDEILVHCPGCEGVIAKDYPPGFHKGNCPPCPGVTCKACAALEADLRLLIDDRDAVKAELADCQALLDKRAKIRVSCHEAVLKYRKQAEKAEASATALVEALRFYADPCGYMIWTNHTEFKGAVEMDRGQRARDALSSPAIRALWETT